jgi:hypothetical protein
MKRCDKYKNLNIDEVMVLAVNELGRQPNLLEWINWLNGECDFKYPEWLRVNIWVSTGIWDLRKIQFLSNINDNICTFQDGTTADIDYVVDHYKQVFLHPCDDLDARAFKGETIYTRIKKIPYVVDGFRSSRCGLTFILINDEGTMCEYPSDYLKDHFELNGLPCGVFKSIP